MQTQALDALEAGRVLMARLPFHLAPDETFLLSPAIMGSERKNISFDAATGRIGNTSLSGGEAERLRDDAAPLRRHGGDVAARSPARLRADAAAGAHQFPPGGDRWPPVFAAA